VKLKDSGIEWLGEIPEHLEVKKLKHLITMKSGEGITREDINEEGTYEVYGGNGFLGFTEDYNVTNDTLIIGRVGAKCGNVHLVCGHKWVTDNALIAKTNQNYRFLFFLLTSMRLNNLANQNAQPLITGTMIKYQIAALPSIDEQDKIVENIESETMRFDTLLRNNQRQIELLKEYRIALISEVVTGKIDVRDVGEQEDRPS
jgi:type I restriction enzyme S subunit